MSLKFSSSLHWKRACTGWYYLFHLIKGNLLIYHYQDTLREKCPYSVLFWSVFSRIRTEYGEMWSISPYLVQMRMQTRVTPNTDTFYAVIVRTWTSPDSTDSADATDSADSTDSVSFTLLLKVLYLVLSYLLLILGLRENQNHVLCTNNDSIPSLFVHRTIC